MEAATTSVEISVAGFEMRRTMSPVFSVLSNLRGLNHMPAPRGDGAAETSAGCTPHTAM